MLMTMTTMKRSNSSPSNSLESPTSTTTFNTDFIFHPPNPPSDHHHYNNLIDFQAGPLLTFDHHRHYSSSSSWDNYDAAASWDDHDHHHPLNVALNNVYVPTKRDGATFHNDTIANNKETTNTADHWLYPDPSTITSVAANSSDVVPHRKGNNHNHKRPNSGEISGQPQKKQSNGSAATNSKSTAKPVKSPSSSSPPISKDPQSVGAKNRRERISERLKVLQELVPNGSKVDMVTMLEKAIGYVKFLQLQVKVLATDEFWPAQGRKAPDITQVKEAIDAILSASRGRNKNSSNSSNSTSEEQEDEEEEE